MLDITINVCVLYLSHRQAPTALFVLQFTFDDVLQHASQDDVFQVRLQLLFYRLSEIFSVFVAQRAMRDALLDVVLLL